MFDWASMPQKDDHGQRTAKETNAFKTALASMEIWYCSEATTVLLLTSGGTPNYFDRGWPNYEFAVSGLRIAAAQDRSH